MKKLVTTTKERGPLIVGSRQIDSTDTKKMRGKPINGKAIFVLCLASFLAGSLFTSRVSIYPPDNKDQPVPAIPNLAALKHDCDQKRVITSYHFAPHLIVQSTYRVIMKYVNKQLSQCLKMNMYCSE